MIKVYRYADELYTLIEEVDLLTQQFRFIPVDPKNADYAELITSSGVDIANYTAPDNTIDAGGDSSLPWEIIPSDIEVVVPLYHQMVLHDELAVAHSGTLLINGTLKLER